MDADYSTLEPEATPVAPLERDPPWSGLEFALLVIFTLLAVACLSILAFLVWAIVARATGIRLTQPTEVAVVWISLLGQFGGMLAGFLLAWGWLVQTRGVRFWRAIQWRAVKVETGLGLVLGGVVLATAGQVASHFLPMPNEMPIDRLFTPQTAWLLLAYGLGIAPFFEEFFFRGLLYPSLLATFREGWSADEAASWHPLVRVVAGLGLLGTAFWHMRAALLAPASNSWLSWSTPVGVAMLALLVAPSWLTGMVRVAADGLARLKRPELLAVLVTGFLFGMMHAVQLGWAWSAVLVLVLVGITLTAVRAVSGSMLASWLVHCAYNGTLFAMQYLATQGFHNFQGPHS